MLFERRQRQALPPRRSDAGLCLIIPPCLNCGSLQAALYPFAVALQAKLRNSHQAVLSVDFGPVSCHSLQLKLPIIPFCRYLDERFGLLTGQSVTLSQNPPQRHPERSCIQCGAVEGSENWINGLTC